MKCPGCGGESGAGKFCRNCGTPVAASGAAGQESIACPGCGTAVRAGAKFCPECATPMAAAAATPVASGIQICVNCGAGAPAGTKFCKSCGKPLAASTPMPPDLMPTAVVSTPVRPAPTPRAAQPPVTVEPQRAATAPQWSATPPPPPPGSSPQLKPRLVSENGETQPTRGSNQMLLIAGAAAVAVVAVGLLYWFVLRKPAPRVVPAAAETAAAQPAAAAPAEASPETANPEGQAPSTPDAQQSAADATGAGTSPAGNTDAAGATPATPTTPVARVPKRAAPKPAAPGYTQAHANAEQALAAAQYLNPPDGSALFWARKAKALGDPGAAEIEQQVFAKQMTDIEASRKSHSYDQARAQIYLLASNFPEHSELRQLQDDIQQEQQKYTQQMEDQRRQAELQTQIKKFAVQHKHGTGSNFCTGIITVMPDGSGRYDCSTADSQGRCEHVTFGPGALKEVKVRGDGSLHVATRQSGNYDFTGSDSTLKDAATALAPLVKH